MPLYVEIETRRAGKETFGPYSAIERGALSEFVGVRPDGGREDIFEATVDGYGCDSCGDFVAFYSHAMRAEVVHVRVFESNDA